MRMTVFILLAVGILTLPAGPALALDTRRADPLLTTLTQAGQGFDALVRGSADELGKVAVGSGEARSYNTIMLLSDLGGMALSQARLAIMQTWHADSSEGPTGDVTAVRDAARRSLTRVAEVMRLLRDAVDTSQAWSGQSGVQTVVQNLRVLALAGDEMVAGLMPLLGNGQAPAAVDTPFAKRLAAPLKELDAPAKKAREQLQKAAKAEEFARGLEVECQVLYATWLLGAATELHAYSTLLPATATQLTHLEQARGELSRQSVTLQAHFRIFSSHVTRSVGDQAGADIEGVRKDLLAVCGSSQGLMVELPSQVGLAVKPVAPPVQTAQAGKAVQTAQVAQAAQAALGKKPGTPPQPGAAPQPGMALLQGMMSQGGMGPGAGSPMLQGLEMMGGMLN